MIPSYLKYSSLSCICALLLIYFSSSFYLYFLRIIAHDFFSYFSGAGVLVPAHPAKEQTALILRYFFLFFLLLLLISPSSLSYFFCSRFVSCFIFFLIDEFHLDVKMNNPRQRGGIPGQRLARIYRYCNGR